MLPRAMKHFYSFLYRRYPFTFAGTLLFLVSLYILSSAFLTGNEYGMILSLLALVLLTILITLSKIQAFRMGRLQINWDAAHPPMARLKGEDQVFYITEAKAFYFFRIHFLLQGTLRAGQNADLFLRTEGAVTAGGELRIPLYFPVSGLLESTGRMLIRDVFGLVRAPFGQEESRQITVLPPVFTDKPVLKYENMASMDTTKKQQSSDEEKYYMREYAPGDRMKDINWKASMRISELITRISPLSPEKSHLMQVEFRHYRDGKQDSAESILHLNYLKSWLLSFLLNMKKRYPDSRFRVLTAGGASHLEDQKDIEAFARTLGELTFVPASGAHLDRDASHQEKFVFITDFDSTLHGILNDNMALKLNIFKTTKARGSKVRRIRFFERNAPELTGGRWLMRRERAGNFHAPPSGSGVIVVEEKIQVKL